MLKVLGCQPSLRFIVPAILLGQTILLAVGACVNSPTFNEPGHLASGVAIWKLGRFDAYKVNPPLVRVVAALPVLLAGVETDWHNYIKGPFARPEFALGNDFIAANGERSVWLFILARWACVPFGPLGGLICYLWARDLYGRRAGLISLVLWCTCPNITAHAQLITPDAAATSLGLAAGYFFWRWLRNPTLRNGLICGLVLGLAELTKTTLLFLYVVWPFALAVYNWPRRRNIKTFIMSFYHISIIYILSMYCICIGYLFEGVFDELESYIFIDRSFRDLFCITKYGGPDENPVISNRFEGSILGKIPVPLPRDYVEGIDLQKHDIDSGEYLSYLGGKFSSSGWWYYYLYAFSVKVPIGTMVLLVLACSRVAWLKSILNQKSSSPMVGSRSGQLRVDWRDEFAVIFPAAAIFVFVSWHHASSEHFRYVLPALGYMYVFIASVSRLSGRFYPPYLTSVVVVAAIVWSAASSLAVYPGSLAYFNEIAGGPSGGSDFLINSNIDWGQDLYRLKWWLEAHPEAQPINLVYFGFFDPRQAGIHFHLPYEPNLETDPPAPIRPGWYAVSINFLRGMPRFTYNENGGMTYISKDKFITFRNMNPIGICGNSILIYNVK